MIYLDANAVSRPRACVAELLGDYFSSGTVGNPSSVHGAGQRARASLSSAREQVLSFLDAGEAEIIFTSGGTEACASMITGFVDLSLAGHILISAIEHPAVTESVTLMAEQGWLTETISVGLDGRVDPDFVVSLVRKDTELVSVMLANNESGAIQPVQELAQVLRGSGYQGLIVSDATQAVGKFQFSVKDLFAAGVDAVSFSAHKFGALSGIGGLVFPTCKKNICREFRPLFVGGTQQNSFRAGTENLPGILALAAVCEELSSSLTNELQVIAGLRDKLWQSLAATIPGLRRLSPTQGPLLANTLQLQFQGCLAADLVVAMDLEGVCISSGAACASGKQDHSLTAEAVGLSAAEAKEVVRISLDWDASPELIEETVEKFIVVVERMRGLEMQQMRGCA